MINVFQPSLDIEELEAIKKVFKSNWLGKGNLTTEFEKNFASHLGTAEEQIRSVGCCTEGLFQSITLLGINPGDEVILPTISFVGAANAIASSGAVPVFCDVDHRTLNPTAAHIEEKISSKTKAVMILHYGGVPCEMEDICELVAQKKIYLIEDSAGSVASQYKSQVCGTFGDIGIWSFDAMKILVTGDGGMIYCKNKEMAQSAEELLYFGLQSKSGMASSLDKKWWEFEISCYGRRSIMNDIASAVGLEQLKKLPSFIDSRKSIHEYYQEHLSGIDWLKLPPEIPDYMESSYYFYWIQVKPNIQYKLAKFLRELEIYTTFRYYPLHWVEFYRTAVKLPNSEKAANTTLCIPIHQALSNQNLEKIVTSISQFGKTLK